MKGEFGFYPKGNEEIWGILSRKRQDGMELKLTPQDKASDRLHWVPCPCSRYKGGWKMSVRVSASSVGGGTCSKHQKEFQIGTETCSKAPNSNQKKK